MWNLDAKTPINSNARETLEWMDNEMLRIEHVRFIYFYIQDPDNPHIWKYDRATTMAEAWRAKSAFLLLKSKIMEIGGAMARAANENRIMTTREIDEVFNIETLKTKIAERNSTELVRQSMEMTKSYTTNWPIIFDRGLGWNDSQEKFRLIKTMAPDLCRYS